MSVTCLIIRRPRQQGPVLWIIDCEQWPRACLRAELIERGYDPRGFIRVDDAFDSPSHGSVQKPQAVVLELRGQNLTSEGIARLRGLAVPIVLMGGITEFNDPLVHERTWARALKRPFSLGSVADLIEQLVPNGLRRRPV
jgi:hypothetical protein